MSTRPESGWAVPFEWSDAAPTHAHAYLVPTVTEWLRDRGGRRVLDLGCGNGAMAQTLAAAGFEVTGVDASETGIRIAAAHVPGAAFVRSSLEDRLPDAMHRAFDSVLAMEVIEHLLLPRVLCARAREALARGGCLILTTPFHGYVKNLALAIAGRYDRHWEPLHDGGHVKFFSRSTLTRLLADEGFTVTRFARVGRLPPLAKSMIVEATPSR